MKRKPLSIFDAAKPFRDAFHYDPGHSDLDNEQPINITVTLGDWRKLEFALSTMPSETARRVEQRILDDAKEQIDTAAENMARAIVIGFGVGPSPTPSTDKKDDDGQTDEKGRPMTYWGGAKSADADKAPAELAVALMALRRHLLATKAPVSEAQLDDLEQAEHALRTVVHSAELRSMNEARAIGLLRAVRDEWYTFTPYSELKTAIDGLLDNAPRSATLARSYQPGDRVIVANPSGHIEEGTVEDALMVKLDYDGSIHEYTHNQVSRINATDSGANK